MSRKFSQWCDKCGVSFMREACIALAMDFGGVQSSRQPHECPEGGDHDFTEPDLEPSSTRKGPSTDGKTTRPSSSDA